ncbi:MAG: hypothetical protein HY040_18800 [Planctomycetes bacterium]|nr:hypothetical protein [Planctomycetota bacterium]
MIECRYCRDAFGTPTEKIGARCPTCRMPLFERDRHKAPPIDLGPCALHKDKTAHGKCQQCGKLICPVCRTRWDDRIICTSCMDAVLSKEPNPRLVRTLDRQAGWSVALATVGWLVLLMTFWPLSALSQGLTQGQATAASLLFLFSFLPALCAAGQGAACIRARGRRLTLATCGVSLAGAQLGLLLGLLVCNVWLN